MRMLERASVCLAAAFCLVAESTAAQTWTGPDTVYSAVVGAEAQGVDTSIDASGVAAAPPPAPPPVIPTMTEWAMILLTLSPAGGAMTTRRRMPARRTV